MLANLVGTVLLLVVGGLCLAYYSSLHYYRDNHKTVGGQGTSHLSTNRAL